MADLLIDKTERTTILTLNRPGKHNALGGSLPEDLSAAIAEFDKDPDQYVAVLTGAGDEAFCAGADLSILSTDADGVAPVIREPDLFGLGKCDKPLIAAVNGFAIGGGFELAMLCDVRLASESAWFSLPEVNWGFIAGIAVNYLPRLLPLGTNMDLFLFAERLTALDGHRLGFVQELAPQGAVMDAALRKANRIGKSSQATIRATKRLLKRHRDRGIEPLHEQYEGVMKDLLASGDAAEGLRAFREKRPPSFRNGQDDWTGYK